MKLFEVYNVEPQFAWLEPALGPEDIKGVRLAFVEPVIPRLNSQIEQAENAGDSKKAEMFRLRKENYIKQGQKFFTPDLGWWMSEEDFHRGGNSFGGFTKGNVLKKYPDLQIFPSKEAAVVAAKKAKVI
jgi:hypothetical protein